MPEFENCLLRLKQVLGTATDKEAAEILGLSDKALNARKRRNAFPETKLYALAAKRPDLKLDVDYVLTGISRAAHDRLAANQAAGERARERGAAFREGWEYNDIDLDRSIQRAKEKDPDGFLAWTRLFLTLADDGKALLHSMSASLTGTRTETSAGITSSDQSKKTSVKKQVNINANAAGSRAVGKIVNKGVKQ
ncbi:MAG: helix-turn-helix domain containing protein [Zoogloeaceae bacterium]|jgi:hypothetical protein|nr:helix-turn-helix domain containing protein [Zoogloeaceae bacterium]